MLHVSSEASCRRSSFSIRHSTGRLRTASAGLIVLAVALLAYPLRAQPIQDSIVVTAHPPGPLGDTAEDVNVVAGAAVQTAAPPAPPAPPPDAARPFPLPTPGS